MWYSGSRGEVDLRVFALGLATSDDGLHFTRHPASPVFTLADGSHSILTPTLVRHPDGSLRLWYASRTKPPFVHKYYAIGTARWPA